jgi:hypothetical protein
MGHFEGYPGKGKAIPIQACTGSEGGRVLKLPELLATSNMKIVSLSVIPKEIFLVRVSVTDLVDRRTIMWLEN